MAKLDSKIRIKRGSFINHSSDVLPTGTPIIDPSTQELRITSQDNTTINNSTIIVDRAKKDESGNNIKSTYGVNVINNNTGDGVQLLNKNGIRINNEIIINNVNRAINADKVKMNQLSTQDSTYYLMIYPQNPGDNAVTPYLTSNITVDNKNSKITASTFKGYLDGNISGIAPNANNVSNSINNKAITDIFESNGTTVKNTTLVQGINLSDDTPTVFGNYTYLKRKLLWSGTIYSTSDAKSSTASFNETITNNDILMIEVEIYRTGKFYMIGSTGTRRLWTVDNFNGILIQPQCDINITTTSIQLGRIYTYTSNGSSLSIDAYCTKVYKLL